MTGVRELLIGEDFPSRVVLLLIDHSFPTIDGKRRLADYLTPDLGPKIDTNSPILPKPRPKGQLLEPTKPSR